jgi:beta-glucosidase-like glycosyl hydrolase
MQATSEDGTPIQIEVSVSSHGFVRLTTDRPHRQPLLSSWDAERLAQQLQTAAREARAIAIGGTR